ncbi:hypothetical protein Anas_04904, partial [Armadillidium nasatum]
LLECFWNVFLVLFVIYFISLILKRKENLPPVKYFNEKRIKKIMFHIVQNSLFENSTMCSSIKYSIFWWISVCKP